MRNYFVPRRDLSLDEKFRARVVLFFSVALAIWAPVYSFLMYGLEPHLNVVISTMGVMLLVGISPFLLRWGVSFFLVGNWLAFNVFWEMLFVGAVAGFGPPPFYWLAVVPMLALVIAGIRSGFFWLFASLISLGIYYQHLYVTEAAGLVLSLRDQLIFEGSVLAGLYILVMLLSLAFERAKNLAMNELRASEEWGRKIVEKAADAILTIDAEGVIYSANRACAAIFDFAEEELHGRNFQELVPAFSQLPPARPTTDAEVAVATYSESAEKIEQCLATRSWVGRVCETLGIGRTNESVPVEVAVENLALGKEERFVVVVRDLTVRKKLEEQRKVALQRSKESFRALIENLPDGLVVHREGTIQYLNPAAARMLACEEVTQLVGVELSEVLPANELEEFHALIDRTRETGELARLKEHHFVTRQGEKVPVESVTFEAQFQNERSLISILRDLTETREMRMHMMQMERMSAVGTLAAGVAHEINNPLTFVIGNLHFVAVEVHRRIEKHDAAQIDDELRRDFEDWSEALDDSLKGAERIRKIVSDLRTYSQRQESEVKPVDVEEVIEMSINMASSEIKHRANLVRDFEKVEPVLGKRGSLGQVVLNLLINAAHAIEEGRVEENSIEVRLHQEDDQVVIEVSDTGSGIPDEVLPQIFDPFFTTKSADQGTGLGLAICSNIVKRLHGELTVKTAPGEGTTFRVVLPVARPEHRTPVKVEQTWEEETFEARPHVLVVDDEAKIRELLTRILSEHFEVQAVSKPGEAFELLHRDPAFDVILCDLMMPEETGIDFFERLGREYPDLRQRVLFITGGAVTQKTADFLKDHEEIVVRKPFRTDQLRRKIRERMGR